MMKPLSKVYPITCHTDHVGKGSTFVAIRGFSSDGSCYISRAIEKGAQTIVIERCRDGCLHEFLICEQFSEPVTIKNNIRYEFVLNARKDLALRAAHALNYPAKRLKIIGVTGTKGKTTVVHLLSHIFFQAGYKTASLSTNKICIGSQEISSSQTTLSSDNLHMLFDSCLKQDVTHVILEVSSHALVLDRIWGIGLSGACITNIGEDHIDFHRTKENYVQAKMSIRDYLLPKAPFVMYSDDFFKERSPYSCSMLLGSFNMQNVAIAAKLACNFGIDQKIVQEACQSFPGVRGRMQKHVLAHGAHAFVDYAHNAFALAAVLKELREETSHLIVVFGCGGNKDKARRASMGYVASRYADKIILTNDNPRNEDPLDIINDICSGIVSEKMSAVSIETDRCKAIALAVNVSEKNSIILIAGKGHESTLTIKDAIIFINDFEEISTY